MSRVVSKELIASNQRFEMLTVCDRLPLTGGEPELVQVLRVNLFVLPSKWNFRFVGFFPLNISFTTSSHYWAPISIFDPIT